VACVDRSGAIGAMRYQSWATSGVPGECVSIRGDERRVRIDAVSAIGVQVMSGVSDR
jgi:hypothetical protein